MFEWLLMSIIFLLIWLIIFSLKRNLRKEMVIVSLLTMPFGLTEPFFIPEYWNPQTIFNLAQKTGFDIESLIFCFAIGGIATVLYELLIKGEHVRIKKQEHKKARHKFHHLILLSPFFIFLLLFIFVDINPIYITMIAMSLGSILTLYCRPDLKNKIWFGGFTFLILYFLFFLVFNLIFPSYIEQVWNLSVISGILILGIPLEELLFAYSFGMLWSSLYEHLYWYK